MTLLNSDVLLLSTSNTRLEYLRRYKTNLPTYLARVPIPVFVTTESNSIVMCLLGTLDLPNCVSTLKRKTPAEIREVRVCTRYAKDLSANICSGSLCCGTMVSARCS